MTTNKEIWTDISGYEGRYQVSNLGRIKSLKRSVRNGTGFRIQEELIMKQVLHPNGYNYIILAKNGTKRTIRVHKIVAESFLSRINNKNYVNHKNGVKNDNRVSNLEYVTPSENSVHAVKNGLIKSGESNYRASLKNNQVEDIIEGISDGFSYKSIADYYGVSIAVIRMLASGRNYSMVTGIKKKTRHSTHAAKCIEALCNERTENTGELK